MKIAAMLVMCCMLMACPWATEVKKPIEPPVQKAVSPALTLAATPVNGASPLVVNFVATCGVCVAYTWSFGDGGIQTVPGPNQNHTYQTQGTYYPLVAATDSKGNVYTGTAIIVATSATGPPNYIGSMHQTNAQLTVIALPSPIPSVGNLIGAGQTYNPPLYGNKIIRCTDVNTDPSNTMYHSWEVADNGGANERVWNSNHTMLRILAADSGSTRIVGFNPATGCTKANTYSKTGAGAVWTRNNPNVDYSVKGSAVSKRTFDYTNPLAAPVIVSVFDYKSCPGLSGLGTVKWGSQLSMEYDDNEIGMAFSNTGGQGTGIYVAVYTLSTGQCQVWNTSTGQSVNPNGPVTVFNSFTLHDFTMGPGGLSIASIDTCKTCPTSHGPFLFMAGTLNTGLITKDTGGHETNGYQTYINVTAAPKMASRLFSNINNPVYITSNVGVKFPTPQDMHIGWQNVDVNDSYPFFGSQMSQQQPLPVKITSPLENEVWGAVPATGTFIRVAPTMSSGIANIFNFRTQNAITGMSPDGACIAWSTDWEGTLGNTDGKTNTCTLGAAKPNICRSDVFIVCPN